MSMMMLVFSLIPFGFEQSNLPTMRQTVAGEVYFIGAVFVLSYIVGFNYWCILFVLFAIPLAGIIARRRKENENEAPTSSHANNAIMVVQLICISCILLIVFYFGFDKASVSRIVAFAIGSLICLACPIAFSPTRRVGTIPSHEATLTTSHFSLPLAIAYVALDDTEIAINVKSVMICVSLLLVIIMLSDAMKTPKH